ncbi:MAG: DUF211 domain-containing protein [Candidatus Bathyarchaeia archaeon]
MAVHTSVKWDLSENKNRIKRIVLDVLKPRDPPIYELASQLADCRGVQDVSITVAEIDQNTESIKVSIEGGSVNIEDVKECLDRFGASIHSVDEVKVTRSEVVT